ncbi:MAG: GGDEF domain-containing protein [Sulfurimonas sp.]|nr:GGDEF domain-containing protein [Sulfurimonas sp.]
MLVFLIFAFFHIFISNKFFIAFIDLFSFNILFYLYHDFEKNHNLKRVSTIVILLLSMFMLTFAFYNHNNSFGLIWSIFIPMFAISQFKPKTGLLISLIFYTFFFSYLLYGAFYWNEPSWDLTSLLRLFFASMLLTFLYFAIERSFANVSKELEKLTNTDALTTLFNRRKIDIIIEENFHKYQRYGTELSIALIDIDDFKLINDTYGHDVGDMILQKFAKLLQANTRKTDYIGRWGGEEFIIIMPETSLEHAELNMQKIMRMLAVHSFDVLESVKCSIGIVQADLKIQTINELFKCADNALYYSKRNGKNQITSHS